MKKTADLSSDLVVVKGSATVAFDKVGNEAVSPVTIRPDRDSTLTFKISSAFRRRFRQCAFEADIKLNELLIQALDAWEEKHGVKNQSSRG